MKYVKQIAVPLVWIIFVVGGLHIVKWGVDLASFIDEKITKEIVRVTISKMQGSDNKPVTLFKEVLDK